MHCSTLLAFTSLVVAASAWSAPYHPMHLRPLRVTRYAPAPPPRRIPVPAQPEMKWERPKRDHDYGEYDGEGPHRRGTSGVTGPVHTFVKTDKNANYKWGVRHHVGNKFAS